MSRDKSENNQLIKRIEIIRQHYDLSQYAMSKQIKITPSFYSYILNGKSGVGITVIAGIAINFPEINLRWLLTGEGEMLGNRGAGPEQAVANAAGGPHDQRENPAMVIASGQQASEPPPGPDAEQIMRLLATLTESEQGSIKTILQAIVGMVKKG